MDPYSWYSCNNCTGLLVDIGATGFKAIWSTLHRIHAGGGEGAQWAIRIANLVGASHDGRLFAYEAPVLDGDLCPESAGVPPLYGLDQFTRGNVLFGGRSGALYCLPDGVSASQISWPKGIRTLQCERSTGGHWLLGVDHWSKVDPVELRRVQAIRSNPSRPVV